MKKAGKIFAFILLLLTLGSFVSQAAPGEYLNVQEFSEDHYMKNLYASETEYFNVGEWEVRRSRLYLSYAVSQLLKGENSEITIYLNNQPVYSGKLGETGGKTEELEVELPASIIVTSDTNALTVSSYMRATDDDPCVDYASDVNWVNIFSDSRIETVYVPLNKPDSISSLYKKLSSIEALDNAESCVFVSGSSEGVLTAAGLAVTGLSGNAVRRYKDLSMERASADKLARVPYALYISDYAELLPEISGLLSAEQKKAAAEDAVAAFLTYKDTRILLITGSGQEALKNAGRMLQNADYMHQLNYTTRNITAFEDFRMEGYRINQYTPLTKNGVYVKGSFRQSAFFYIDWPANRRVSPSSELSLDLRYSENLDFERSLVTVFVNGQPIGSCRPDREHAGGLTCDLPFPEDTDIKGSFSVEVAFDLETNDEFCHLTPEEQPWGYVSKDSMLKLKSADDAELLFDNYPSPFIRDGSFNRTLIVLPEAYSDADLEAMHRVCLGLGRFLKDNCGELTVTGSADQGSLAAKNIIAIGTDGRNAAERFPAGSSVLYYDGGRLISDSEKLKIDPDFGRNAGMGLIMESPFDKQSAVMVISGAGDNEMLSAAEYAADTDILWKISGDAYLVDSEGRVTAYALKDVQPEEKDEADAVRKQAAGFSLAAVLIMIVCAASVSMLVWKRRGKRG